MTFGGLLATAFATALVLSLLLPLVVKPLLVRLGIMDVPNERSSHERPVIRGLGLAVLIAIVLVEAAAVWAFLSTVGAAGWDWRLLLVIALGSFCSGLLGLGEDLKGVSVGARSAFLLVIAAGAAIALIWIARSAFEAGSFGWWVTGVTWHSGWLAALPLWALALLAVYGVLFISSYINVANFMDGLNGISGLHGVVAGLAFAAAGWCSGYAWLIVAGLVLAAGFGGFLPWNLTKPGAFMGDVGSYLLGGAVAITSFAALVAGVPVLATIGPMVIYFGDVGVTLVRRLRSGYRWDEPHKEHVYQRLQQLGLSHLAASGVNAAFTVAASALGLVSFFVSPVWWLLLLVLGLALVVLYHLTPRLLAH